MTAKRDALLIREARTDPDAFGELYRRHAQAVHSFVRGRVPERVAGELTAETFAQAALSLKRFRDEAGGSGLPWLYGIARNLDQTDEGEWWEELRDGATADFDPSLWFLAFEREAIVDFSICRKREVDGETIGRERPRDPRRTRRNRSVERRDRGGAGPRRRPLEGAVRRRLEAIANFIDLKSPYTLGHARAVADLAGDAAAGIRLPETKVRLLRRAGLVHDFGRLGVSNAIWDKRGPLGAGEWERVRLHPYNTERMLHASPSLAPLGSIAVQHRERLDGSGYPRGLSGSAISRHARIIGTADAYQAMREPRPYRPERPPEEVATELRPRSRQDGSTARRSMPSSAPPGIESCGAGNGPPA